MTVFVLIILDGELDREHYCDVKTRKFSVNICFKVEANLSSCGSTSSSCISVCQSSSFGHVRCPSADCLASEFLIAQPQFTVVSSVDPCRRMLVLDPSRTFLTSQTYLPGAASFQFPLHTAVSSHLSPAPRTP